LIWNLEAILKFLEWMESRRPGKEVFVQYILIRGVNDSAEDAAALAQLLAERRVKINVIPFNPFEESRFERPSDAELDQFVTTLKSLTHHRVLVRFSKGRDIAGACGQLALRLDP